MASNIERFKKDLQKLVDQGDLLDLSMRRQTAKKEFDDEVRKQMGKDADDFLKALPVFEREYQAWYSEAMAVIHQLLPERLEDFKRHYDKPKSRKEITYENYHIEDYLQGLQVTRLGGAEVVVDGSAALPRFSQQLAILSAAEKRFESSLFEIRQLVQADLFDSEVEAARELLKNKFARAAGAVVGVVLEKHLAQVCQDHGVKVIKKNPSISDLNELLKKAKVIETAQWRFIQHLGDLRNLCDHNKEAEPVTNQVSDLIDGVAKVMKTVI
jgi:hypothetical protein